MATKINSKILGTTDNSNIYEFEGQIRGKVNISLDLWLT